MGKYSTKALLVALSCLVFASCGGSGGGDSDSGTVFEGVLAQGDGVVHSERDLLSQVAHGAGEFIENVEVCALGECSKTDATGRWGFATASRFAGGEVLFSIVGHGIDAAVVLDVPSGADNVVVEFENHGAEGVHAHSVLVDGTEAPQHHE